MVFGEKFGQCFLDSWMVLLVYPFTWRSIIVGVV